MTPASIGKDGGHGAFSVVEAGISELRQALETGATTSEALVRQYLERIQHYDSSGIRLNAMVVLNPEAVAEARASDARRAAGKRWARWTAFPIPPRTATW